MEDYNNYTNTQDINWRIKITEEYIKKYPEDAAAKRALERLKVMRDKEQTGEYTR